MKTRIKCPPAFESLLEDLRELTPDPDNPNVMTEDQHKSVWKSLETLGWVDVIVTNEAGMIADGEQRVTVCLEPPDGGEPEIYGPVLRLPLSDVDRRLVRQVKNKLRGKHDKLKDADEFVKLLEAERAQDLRELIGLSEKKFQATIEKARLEREGADEEESDVEPETRKYLTECPKCEYQFNPDNFMVDTIVTEKEEESIEHFIESGEDRGLGKTNTVILDLTFETTPPELTERVANVAESFGVGVDETIKFRVFEKFELGYEDTDLVYITGDSGSGKTTFLRLLGKHEVDRGRSVHDFEKIEPGFDEVVIDGLGGDTDEAMRLLSAAGMSEAFLMLRRYGELSDGQKYRYRLAKLLSMGSDVYLIDELGASLDRVMAKILAFNLQKWARREGKMVVAASTHHDLIEDFNPNILIFKGFGEAAQIRYFNAKPRRFSLEAYMTVSEATMEDYELLESFHYLGNRPAFMTHKFRLTYKGYSQDSREKTIGIIIFQSPFLTCSARNKAMPQYKRSNTKEGAELVNREIVRLSRIIIHPKFRGAGLAVKLVKETMALTGKRVVETIAAMARYNPFFEKAGMTKVGVMKLTKQQRGILSIVKKLGSDPVLMHSPHERKAFIDGLNSSQKDQLTNALMANVKAFQGHGGRGGPGMSPGRGKRETMRMMRDLAKEGLESLLGNLIPTERVYLYWENPDYKGDE